MITKDELIQELVNALSGGYRYTSAATKESFRADDVLAETNKALEHAAELGFQSTRQETK